MSKLEPNEAADLTEKGEKHFLAEEQKPREGIEILSQHKVQMGKIGVTFTVGRLKPRT